MKEAFEYLPYLSLPVGTSLLKAVQPLLRLNSSFQDYVVLVLRKAMFHREEGARQLAANGLLFLMSYIAHRKHALAQLSMSQPMTTGTDSLVDAAGVLQSELLGMRLCFPPHTPPPSLTWLG